MKNDGLDYELVDDFNLYEIGFSKKNGRIKSDYPSKYFYILFRLFRSICVLYMVLWTLHYIVIGLDYRAKNICKSVS